MAQIHPIPTNPLFHNLTGRRFSSWVVESYGGRNKRTAYWNCRCDCGVVRTVVGATLVAGTSKNCGCVSVPKLIARNKAVARHGLSHTKVHRTWAAIRTRCEQPNSKDFKRWGGRGIKVCERWHTFENFLADMGMPPTEKHSIDRIDNNGDYEPGNCKWSTWTEQASNRRSSRIIEFKGRSQTVTQWAEELGIPMGTLFSRLRKWDTLRALATPWRGHYWIR